MGPAKKAKISSRPAAAEELQQGTAVLYRGLRGQIRDAFIPLDQFWVSDEAGEIVREDGDIVTFKSSELRIPCRSEEASNRSAGGVLLLATEDQTMKILNHFGPADTTERQIPQQLFAVQCGLCEVDQLERLAADAVEDGVLSLAKRLREDIQVAPRAQRLRQAVLKLGQTSLTSLQGYYVVASVHIPCSRADEASEQRREEQNQVDICVTASGEGDETSETLARKALVETCGVEVSDFIWSEKAQRTVRSVLGVELPLEFIDADDMTVRVMVLPQNARDTAVKGILLFTEASPQDLKSSEATQGATGPAQTEAGKTIAEWDKKQEEFAHLPKLPPGWLRVRSRSGKIYYFSKRTQQATFEFPGPLLHPKPPSQPPPLPEGWIQETSKSTGKIYYFHGQRNVSTFTRPTS